MTQENTDVETTVVIEEEAQVETAVDEVVEINNSDKSPEPETKSEDKVPTETSEEVEKTKQEEAVEEKSEETVNGTVAETQEEITEPEQVEESAVKEDEEEKDSESTETVADKEPVQEEATVDEEPAKSEEVEEEVAETKSETIEEDKPEEVVEETVQARGETPNVVHIDEHAFVEAQEDVASEENKEEQSEPTPEVAEEKVEEVQEEQPEPTPEVTEEKAEKVSTVSVDTPSSATTDEGTVLKPDMILVEIDGKMVEVSKEEADKYYKKVAAEEAAAKKAKEAEEAKVAEANKEPEIQRNIPEKGKRTVYERDPVMDKVMLMTVRSLKRQLNHITDIRASSKNNRHYTLVIESNKIQNMFLHGISRSNTFTKDDVILALQTILNHWNENLGVLPDNNFNVCVMRLELDRRLREVEVSKNSLLRDDEIRKKVYSHYMNSRWEWSFRSILPVLELVDSAESRTRYVDGEIKTRVRVGSEWTPFLEDMEKYFSLKEKPFGDVDIPNHHQREVGITLSVVNTRNPRIVGHLVKLNAIRKVFMEERAEDIKTGKIEISEEQRVEVKELDASDLENSLKANMG